MYFRINIYWNCCDIVSDFPVYHNDRTFYEINITNGGPLVAKHSVSMYYSVRRDNLYYGDLYYNNTQVW